MERIIKGEGNKELKIEELKDNRIRISLIDFSGERTKILDIVVKKKQLNNYQGLTNEKNN